MQEEKRLVEQKRLFEGECCALSYNDNDAWFDDEDDEFQFDPKGSNKWFEQALEQGLKEQEEMRRGPERKRDERKELKEKELKDEEKMKEKEHDTIVINIIFQ